MSQLADVMEALAEAQARIETLEAELATEQMRVRVSGVRAAAARIREAHDVWLDTSKMGSLSFGILIGIRRTVDGITKGLEAWADELEKEHQ